MHAAVTKDQFHEPLRHRQTVASLQGITVGDCVLSVGQRLALDP